MGCMAGPPTPASVLALLPQNTRFTSTRASTGSSVSQTALSDGLRPLSHELLPELVRLGDHPHRIVPPHGALIEGKLVLGLAVDGLVQA
mmetsp:Transcript_30782/g.52671  ORF Transcript_30782/g.52671 Transcript_30782/m.52671 type:complete len:89 (-) Transcript_30782:1392-1658(-)